MPETTNSQSEKDLRLRTCHIAHDLHAVLESPVFFGPEAHMLALEEAPAHFLARFPSPPLDARVSPSVSDAFCAEWRILIERETGIGALISTLEEELRTFTSARLGLLFERYIAACLAAAGLPFKMGIPVRTPEPRGAGILTWGECDVLLFNAVGREDALAHWEIAVKYYLQIEPSTRWRACVGPGLRDRLDLKGAKIFLQQLPLSATREGREALGPVVEDLVRGARSPVMSGNVSKDQEQGRHPNDRCIERRAFVKGAVFYRYNNPTRTPDDAWKDGAHPRGLSDHHSRGWWVAPNDVRLVRAAHPDLRVVPLPRLRWLGGFAAEEVAEGSALSWDWDEFERALPELLKEKEVRSECLLVALHDKTSGAEKTRGFIATQAFVAGAAESVGKHQSPSNS